MVLADALRTAGVARVYQPTDAAYAAAVSGFDVGTPMRPDVVVDAQGAADIASAVAVAAEYELPVTVLGSGHGRLHSLDGGLAITTRTLAEVQVDVAARTARIGAGCTWDPVLAAVTPHGLAAACGSAPSVGVAGFLLGGGIGPLVSTLGFGSDYVRSIEMVTPADGRLTVTANEHPDLYWAARGGKGGFGIVTAVTVDLLPLVSVVGGGLYFSAADARAVLYAYCDWADALPPSSTASFAMLRLPALDTLPAPLRGQHVVHVRYATVESLAAATTQLADMRSVAKPLVDTVAVLPYGELGTIHGDPTSPMPVANGTASLAELSGPVIDALLAAAGPDVDVPLSSVEVRTLGSAAHAAPSVPDAVGGRGTRHVLNVYAAPSPTLTDDERLAVVRRVLDATRPWQSPITLVNFVGRANNVDAVTGSWTLDQNDRLDAVRGLHDPGCLFPFAGHQPRHDPPDAA